LRISLLMLVLALVFSVNANAMFGSRSNYKWWKDPQIASELNLSREQVNSIDEIFSKYKERFVGYQKKLKQSEVELKKELQDPNVTKEEVLKTIDSIEDTKAAYIRTKVEMYLKVKDVLTPQQETTLHKIKLRFKPYHR